MEIDEDDLKTSPAEAVMSHGLDNVSPSPPVNTLTARDAVLATSLGPGPATYASRAHAVEFELQAGSLDEEMPLEVAITQGLAFVDCGTEESGRWEGCVRRDEWIPLEKSSAVFHEVLLTRARKSSTCFLGPMTIRLDSGGCFKWAVFRLTHRQKLGSS